jgi:hypothetical protein
VSRLELGSPGDNSQPQAPERRVNAEQLLAHVNAIAGTQLVLLGTADHGESGGAVYAQWPDGRPAVITRSHTVISLMRQTADVLNELRSTGLPVPRHDLIAPLPGGAVAVVQEHLPGQPPNEVDVNVIDAMVRATEQFSDALTSHPDVPVKPLHLRSSGPGFMRHETLAAYSPRSRKLLHRILDIGRRGPDTTPATTSCTRTTP